MDDLTTSGALAAAAAELVDAADVREAARVVARACEDLGADGAEVWCSEDGGWRRLTARGRAVLGHVLDPAEALEPADDAPYPGTLAVLRSGRLAVAARCGHPGTDRREAIEEAVEALLATCALLGFNGFASDGPEGPSRWPHAA